ncbi:hypothetical protein C8Q70DRAFT_139429 [Cubamyces menziesii]|nr:hypothetical protein C8Q70DRAFT_139429 [Cubamyces menziesii]
MCYVCFALFNALLLRKLRGRPLVPRGDCRGPGSDTENTETRVRIHWPHQLEGCCGRIWGSRGAIYSVQARVCSTAAVEPQPEPSGCCRRGLVPYQPFAQDARESLVVSGDVENDLCPRMSVSDHQRVEPFVLCRPSANHATLVYSVMRGFSFAEAASVELLPYSRRLFTCTW